MDAQNEKLESYKFEIPIGNGGYPLTARVTEDGLLIDEFTTIPWEWIDSVRRVLSPPARIAQEAVDEPLRPSEVAGSA